MPIIELVLRLALAFATLLAITRLMGRKELSQLTFFNFVSAISIGTIGASLAVDSSLSIRNGLIALGGWTVFTVFLGYIDIKSKKVREIIEGQPTILIKKGQIMERALRQVRLDTDALKALLREKNVFFVSDVDYAIFETDGKLSVMKKEAHQPLVKSDIGPPTMTGHPYPPSTEVIMDGIINTANLEKLNLTSQWLETQLKTRGISTITEVFYAEVLKNGTLYIDLMDDRIK